MRRVKAGKLLIATASLWLFMGAGRLEAQENSQSSREQRIREHQDRIQKIIEESRKRREQQQQNATQGAAPPAAPGTAPTVPGQTPAPAAGGSAPPYANRPGQPLPTGPVQARVTPAVQKPGQTPNAAAQAPQTARSESRTILLFHPIDSIVDVGDRFKTDVVAETKEGEVDEVSFLLKYPRHVLNPLGLDHGALDQYVKHSIDYEFDPDEGTIYVHAKLKKPTRFSLQSLVSIVWEALEPTDGSMISYEFGEKKTTGLFLKGSNLLGTLPGADDGVIKTTVQITSPKSKATVTKLPDGLLIGAEPARFVDDRPQDRLSFDLRSSIGGVRAGEIFDVDVILNNPGEELMDRVRLYVQFDPAELSVVDSDAGNVVKRGINIADAKSRSEFPFDYHRYNYADNGKGLIVYEVSASNSNVRGEGKIATIRFQALKQVQRAEIVLVQNAEGLTPTTDVSYLGKSVLATAAGLEAKPIDGVAMTVEGVLPEGSEELNVPGINPFESELAQRMRSKGLE